MVSIKKWVIIMNKIKLLGLKNDISMALLYLRLNRIKFKKRSFNQENRFIYSMNIVTKTAFDTVKNLLNARFGQFIKVSRGK
jgi:hypothetical protein